ncbi:MAG TPA: metal-dependent transcriptional regulator [Planctomycetota bacterium]|nr:metal-dependent transcriptional regulator [Planctomycetota bacterium]
MPSKERPARSRRSSEPPSGTLSTAHEDYLETIHQLSEELEIVRVTDIASRLGVKLPSVTRAVQALRRQGFVAHEARRDVRLTASGRRMAEALSHRHADLVRFLVEVLGVPADIAEADTCQMEHGLSAESAQRLHEFLDHLQGLDPSTLRKLRPERSAHEFEHLPDGKSAGWRA